MSNYRRFLDFLNGEKSGAILFEPFPHRRLVTQLIWRGGDSLWNTPERRIDTLVEFYSYIKSDVAVVEPKGELEAMLASVRLPDGMRLVVISDDARELALAEASDAVCALATRGTSVGLSKPLIRLARENESADETFEAYLCGDFSAVYLRDSGEKFADRSAVLGGFGTGLIDSLGPLEIYDRTRLLDSLGCAIGSGGVGEYCEYLGFISMLGMYNKL